MPERATRPPAPPRIRSIGAVLEEAAQRLERSGVPQARREATSIWAAVAGPRVTPGDVWLQHAAEPAAGVAQRFRDAVERRSRGIPFAYAVGRAGFRDLELRLDPRALIPRPETEGLVDLVLRWTHEGGKGEGGKGKGGVAADIGTGCGCIALALAVEGHFDRVVAVERSAAAAALARENVARVGPPTPVEVREGDLLAPLAGARYRAIVSNPPYLTEGEYAALDPAVRGFEPREALVSGPEGLDATRDLLVGAAARLEPGGLLALEVDERRAERVRALARKSGWSRVAIYEDLFGRPRFLLAFAKEES
ncbi:MAG TPA: peptide chain release factor N(5)-glutamine methyltransferase [Gemmatimonadales bacterium]|nr:peptide chain release factor N(5)-glutamine methyltransferase [Gemmatimonadales bacterium]